MLIVDINRTVFYKIIKNGPILISNGLILRLNWQGQYQILKSLKSNRKWQKSIEKLMDFVIFD